MTHPTRDEIRAALIHADHGSNANYGEQADAVLALLDEPRPPTAKPNPAMSEYERGHRDGVAAVAAGHDDIVRGLEDEIARLRVWAALRESDEVIAAAKDATVRGGLTTSEIQTIRVAADLLKDPLGSGGSRHATAFDLAAIANRAEGTP